MLRIHTEDDHLIVPIHAYPVLDRKNLRNIFPKLIDFGLQTIGSRKSYVSHHPPLTNTDP